MPQIARSRRPLIDQRSVPMTDKGDICYVFTKEIIIPAWRENSRWDTISALRMMLVVKPDLNKLKSMVRGTPFSDDEILNQAALAFVEFYRRCGGPYEDAKVKKNGDVYAGLLYSRMPKGE